MKHETVNCRFRSEDKHWICFACGKDAGNKYPEPNYFDLDHDRQPIPQCDGVQITLSTPHFVHSFKLTEKTNVLLYFNTNLSRGMPARQTFRFSRSVPVTWERVGRDLSVESITDPESIAELNFVLKTLRTESKVRNEAASAKRKATIASKKQSASA